jgi:hypothetical protein
MRNGEKYNSRRSFVKGIAASLLFIPFFQFCKEEVIKIAIRLSGTDHILGHKLRLKNFPKPSLQIKVPYLIVGAGISGLSASRQFAKRGISDFLLVEMEGHLGGNSSNGENKYSKFPLGAHYLPLPNFEDKALIDFLKEEKIIVSFDHSGLPVFDELQLTFAPEERLFYKNNWQEGLVPKDGNAEKDDAEIIDFFTKMDAFRTAKGNDGKYLFMIPLSWSSNDKEARSLDEITMEQWFVQHKFTSKVLYTYLDYCCKDDFGLGIAYVSAWAGIHYFAARKHNSTKEAKDMVLTWPEGNARLAQHLKKYSEDKTLKNHLVYEVIIENDAVIVNAFDNESKKSVAIIADKIIMATPQFVNQYILPKRKEFTKDFCYTPWLLATLIVTDLLDNESYPLCWDNVIHGSKGLGYIYDQHQSLEQMQTKKVITYYYSFSSEDSKKTRSAMYQEKVEHWKQFVFADLKLAHPDIEKYTEQIDIHLLGHGMISPAPDFIFGEAKRKASQSIEDKIFFAHTDVAGISIFEEAFHQGINVVNQILDGTTMDS